MRAASETVVADGGWHRLTLTPVAAITAVAAIAADGTTTVLAVDAYAIDIDANGDGWVRVAKSARPRARVSTATPGGGVTNRWGIACCCCGA